jgi:alpha-beta hydrolase superfamily lysophospholipase
MTARVAAGAVALALLLSACSGEDGSSASGVTTTSTTAATTSTTYADLYEPPGDLPAEHGRLLRHEPILDSELSGAVLERVLYASTSVAGDPIAVSGLIAYPEGDAPADGWPVVTWAHGTTGIADRCAPSKFPDEYFNDIAPAFIASGYAILGTDYEGLGTPGRHPWLEGTSEGRGVLDIVAAASEIADAHLSDRYAIFGHSQGGHAAVFASELAAEWLPDRELVGTIAAAPASELPTIGAAVTVPALRGFGALLLAGLSAAHPEARLEDILHPAALERLDLVDTECILELFGAFGDLAEFTTVSPADVQPWKQLLLASDPGHRVSEAPLLIVHGTADPVVPPALSELLFDRLCGLGQVAERELYDGADHTTVLHDAADDMASWLRARFAGEPATTGCA